MVGRGAKATVLQTCGGVFHFRAAVAVNNAGFAALLLHVAQKLVRRLEFFHQHVADVGAVEAADLNKGIVKPEQAHDVQTRGVIRRGGECHKRQRRETLAELAERGVFRTEIVTPLGDTVRFVDRQQHRVPVRQMFEEVVQHQTFRGDVQQANLPGTASGHHFLLLFTSLSGVDTGSGHAVRQQLIHLIFHQGNER